MNAATHYREPKVIATVHDRHMNFQADLLALAMSKKFEITVEVRKRVANREIAPGFEIIACEPGPMMAMAAFAGGYLAALDDLEKHKGVL
jgi:hypothetical protein